MLEPDAPRLQVYTACFLKKQHDTKSSTRENDAIERHNKHEMYEAAADVTRHPVYRKPFL